jgi:transposase-like protein
MLNPSAREPSQVHHVDPAPKPERRSFTAEYRASVVAEYEAAPHGEKSAVLRREGIYQTQVAEWARARDAAAQGRPYRRDRTPRSTSKQTSAATRAVKLEAENKRLARQLEQTQAALDVMGKAHRLLELLSESTDESPSSTSKR